MNKNKLFARWLRLMAAVVLIISGALSANSAEPSKPPAVDSPRLKIQRSYSETEIDDIFAGKTAQPASFRHGLWFLGRVMELTKAKTIVPAVLKDTLSYSDNRKRSDGFEIGEIHFESDSLSGDYRLIHGATGLRFKRQPATFAALEKYLFQHILEVEGEAHNFQTGSFTGKTIGEASWRRVDEKNGVYELVFVRGLTIAHLRFAPRQGTDLQKNIGNILDTLGDKIDAWIQQNMFIHK